jgi:hypothetical protein
MNDDRREARAPRAADIHSHLHSASSYILTQFKAPQQYPDDSKVVQVKERILYAYVYSYRVLVPDLLEVGHDLHEMR